MKEQEFIDVFAEQIDQCSKVLIEKAREYATEDRLHNFKVAANLRGTNILDAVGGMMVKHTVSVYDLIRSEPGKFSSEVWDEKITDHINYLILLKAAYISTEFTPNILTYPENFTERV